jgi:hypothetical protein
MNVDNEVKDLLRDIRILLIGIFGFVFLISLVMWINEIGALLS